MEGFSPSMLCPSLVLVISHKHEIKRRAMMISQFKPTTRLAVIFSIALLLSICCFTVTRLTDKNVEAPRPKVGEPTVSKKYSYESNRADHSRRPIERFREQAGQASEQLRKAREELEPLRQHLRISDQDGKAPLGIMDPETVRIIELQYNSILQSLRQKSRKELRDAIPKVYPDTALSDLLSKLNQAEKQYAEDSSQFSSQNPRVVAINALIVNLNEQIEGRVDRVLLGLEVLAKAYCSGAKIEREAEQAKKKDADNLKIEALRQFLDKAFPKKPAASTK
jgi:uncharacterized protein involved in exopolysaccharide biosynthesis